MLRVAVDIPKENLTNKGNEIIRVDFKFTDGKLCDCTYNFQQLSKDDKGEIVKNE